jgi:hypothetical protein
MRQGRGVHCTSEKGPFLRQNGVEPLAWLTNVLERMVSGRTKATELERLLPWNWKAEQLEAAVNA